MFLPLRCRSSDHLRLRDRKPNQAIRSVLNALKTETDRLNNLKSVPSLTGGRLLALNTIWNLAGQLLPMVVALVTIPVLIRGLGVPRFGVLSIAWIVIGYFSLFDLGIGRALTKLISDKLGTGEDHHIPPLAWTGLLLMLLMGILAGAVTAILSPWLVHRALKIPSDLQTETVRGFYLLAVSIPLVTMVAGLRGILEAQQRFRILNLIRIPMSIFSFAGPLLVLPFSHSLVPIIGVLVAGRFVGFVAHQVACLHSMPSLRNLVPRSSLIGPLVRTGGWMTVSNVVGPLLLYVDRFLIGALLSLAAVGYYTAPFDMVNRLVIIPTAIAGVLFPAFAVSMAQDPSRTALLLVRGVKYTFFAVFPLVLIVVSFAPEILHLWLGTTFADNSGTVLRWLAAGILMNSVTVIPFALLQGIGRADITGKLLMADLAVYLLGAWVLISRFGIKGAAIAWAVRATVEAVVFMAYGRHFLPKGTLSLKGLGLGATAAMLTIYFSTLNGPTVRGAFLLCAMLVFILVGFRSLTHEERSFLSPSSQRLRVAGRAASISVSSGGGSV
jgi:O-antigen/teichoic acid export membrane protein